MIKLSSLVRNALLSAVFLVLLNCLFTSCVNTRKLTYMQGSFDTTKLSQVELMEPVVQKGDILSIIVYSDNPAATLLFNQQNGGGASGVASSGAIAGGGTGATVMAGGTASSGGYLVDEQGNIQMQQLGLIHAEGLSRSALRDTLESKLKLYLQNPYCTVRFLNYRFTLLGEVNHPGVFPFPGDRVNLLEALGYGGDLTFYGRRDNILVIRERDGKREFGRMDITKPEVMTSPYFNLQPNDIVYVEANRKKAVANDQTALRTITIATALISTFAILYSIFK